MLDVSYEKLTRLLLRRIFLMFPMLVGLTIGIIGNSAILSVKTFLLVELGMAVLSPLFSAVITSGVRTPSYHSSRTTRPLIPAARTQPYPGPTPLATAESLPII